MIYLVLLLLTVAAGLVWLLKRRAKEQEAAKVECLSCQLRVASSDIRSDGRCSPCGARYERLRMPAMAYAPNPSSSRERNVELLDYADNQAKTQRTQYVAMSEPEYDTASDLFKIAFDASTSIAFDIGSSSDSSSSSTSDFSPGGGDFGGGGSDNSSSGSGDW